MSPTATCPASYPYTPGKIPSRTTPVIPGRRISRGWTAMSQIEVPTTETNVPGFDTPAPGTDAKESTLPTATGVEPGRRSSSATSARSVPAVVPRGTNVLPSLAAGWSKPG